MKSLLRYTLAVFTLALAAGTAVADNTVVVLEIKGGIGVATADYLTSGLEHAREQNAELVRTDTSVKKQAGITFILFDMDTPGGLVKPMREMVQKILNSPVPVATFVTPAGARADSAGTYILLASHVAAMAPTTHLGAATPVSLDGDDVTPDQVEEPAADERYAQPIPESQPMKKRSASPRRAPGRQWSARCSTMPWRIFGDSRSAMAAMRIGPRARLSTPRR